MRSPRSHYPKKSRWRFAATCSWPFSAHSIWSQTSVCIRNNGALFKTGAFKSPSSGVGLIIWISSKLSGHANPAGPGSTHTRRSTDVLYTFAFPSRLSKQQHWHHLGKLLGNTTSDLTPGLLNQNLQFNKISSGFVSASLRSSGLYLSLILSKR